MRPKLYLSQFGRTSSRNKGKGKSFYQEHKIEVTATVNWLYNFDQASSRIAIRTIDMTISIYNFFHIDLWLFFNKSLR